MVVLVDHEEPLDLAGPRLGVGGVGVELLLCDERGGRVEDGCRSGGRGGGAGAGLGEAVRVDQNVSRRDEQGRGPAGAVVAWVAGVGQLYQVALVLLWRVRVRLGRERCSIHQAEHTQL